MENEKEHDILTKLDLIVRGNGSKGLVKKVETLEEKFHKISNKLTVVVVLLAILIAVQAPTLMVGLRGF